MATFKTAYKNSNFTFSEKANSRTIQFMGGEYTTEDVVELEELRATCISSNGFIVEDTAVAARELTPEELAAASAAIAQAKLEELRKKPTDPATVGKPQ